MLKFGHSQENWDSEQEETFTSTEDEFQFSNLQDFFVNKAATERGKGLTFDEFKDAMLSTIGWQCTDAEIELLFKKIDANCDGVINWEEFVTFNILEYKEKSFMFELLREQPFPNEIREVNSLHRDIIVKVLFFPLVRKIDPKRCTIDSKVGRYMTLSKEGVVGVWTLKMKNVAYYNAQSYRKRNVPAWFTDMVAMYNVNMVAITSTDRDITIYDLSGKQFFMRYYVTGFDSCVTCMDYWASTEDLNRALLLFGDTTGSVLAIKFYTCQTNGPFGTVDGKNTCKKVSFPEVMKGFVPGARVHKVPNVHEDWVNNVRYLPGIDCFLSSCQGMKSGLFFGDFAYKKTHVYFRCKNVLCFDHSIALNTIVTGGMDYLVRVWNIYVPSKAIVLLKGHTKPINHILLYSEMNQVISIDKGRSLRVYDLKEQTCMQHISGRYIKFDHFSISAMTFHPPTRTMLLAATKIVLIEKRDEEGYRADVVSHNYPLVGAMFSPVFNSVVSACVQSTVSIWDPDTGEKVMHFTNAHYRIEQGVEIPVEITTMCFDHNGRRLLTGARNGTIHVWNFNNGSLMQSFTLPDNSAVTGLVATKRFFYVCGWGKTVHWYLDGGGEIHRKNWKTQHKDDVLCIAFLAPNIIAAAAYDGDIIAWALNTSSMFCRLNASESIKPLGELAKRKSKKSASSQKSDSEGARTPETTSVVEEEAPITTTTASLWSKGKNKAAGHSLFNKLTSVKKEEIKETPTCHHPLLHAMDSEAYTTPEQALYTRKEYDSVCKRYESAVERIIFLQTRDYNHKDTAALVASGAEGWVRFWSMHHDGGLLGQFNAAHRVGESVLAIKGGTDDRFLVTGDTQGYVKIWDIREYCTNKKLSVQERQNHFDRLKNKFTYYRVENYHVAKQSDSVMPESLKSKRPPPSVSEPGRTLKYPSLVNSFRAHTLGVNSLDYLSERDIIITASGDCSVRLWTINGQYIGTFGGEPWTTLPYVVDNDYFISQIPYDIRRSASARTLKVLHGGQTPRWEGAFNIIRQRGIDRLKKQFDHLKTLAEVAAEKKAESEAKAAANILGKSYKKTMRHQIEPKLKKTIETSKSVAVYHTLPFSELESTEEIDENMKKLSEKRHCTFAVNRMRGVVVKRQEQPAIIAMFNKVVSKKGPVLRKVGTNRIKKVADKHKGPPIPSAIGPRTKYRSEKEGDDRGNMKIIPLSHHRSTVSDTESEESFNVAQSVLSIAG